MKTVVQLAVNKGLSTAVSAIPTKSELEIKSINPKYRQCLFADEVKILLVFIEAK